MAMFTAYIFDGTRTAQKALDALYDNDDVYPWVDDVATISRDKLGRVRIHSTWAQDEMGSLGLGMGALTGALLGALVPPVGVAASEAALAGSAVGGSLWGIMGLTADAALDDPKLDQFADKLKKDTSAIVLVTDELYYEDFISYLEPMGGTIYQTSLDGDDIKYIQKKVKEYS